MSCKTLTLEGATAASDGKSLGPTGNLPVSGVPSGAAKADVCVGHMPLRYVVGEGLLGGRPKQRRLLKHAR